MRIAIIGTRGIPPRYGGFETLASELSHELATRGHEVIVYGRRGQPQPKHIEIEPGVFAHRLWVIRIEALESLSAGLFGAIHSLFHYKPDVALLCNPGNVWVGKFLQARGIPVILHMAGLEFKREKWQGLGSRVLWRALNSAVKSSLTLLTDSNAIATWYREQFNRDIEVISYGAKPVLPDERILTDFELVKNEYDIVVARFEPDTQIVNIIQTHARSGNKRLVLVGETQLSRSMQKYSNELDKAIKSHPNLLLLGPIWDERTLDTLWHFSRTYIHGHRTGGTNPALVRAAGAGAEILAFDNDFNREVLGQNGWYWSSDQQLGQLFHDQPWLKGSKGDAAKLSTLERYQWSSVAEQYEDLMQRVCTSRRIS